MAKSSAARVSRKQLDRRLAEVAAVVTTPPPRGWVRAIRTALGMSMRQMAERMGSSSPSAVVAIERNESNGAVSLRRLRAAAEALECDLVYVLVPKAGSLDETLRKRADEVAHVLVGQVDRHMLLEDQGVEAKLLKEQADELASDLLQGAPSRLWERLPR